LDCHVPLSCQLELLNHFLDELLLLGVDRVRTFDGSPDRFCRGLHRQKDVAEVLLPRKHLRSPRHLLQQDTPPLFLPSVEHQEQQGWDEQDQLSQEQKRVDVDAQEDKEPASFKNKLMGISSRAASSGKS
jgi:hypothetical protein